MESEIQSLRANAARLREEASAMVFGFILGGMGSGFVVQWYLHAQHIRPTDTMIPMIVEGCVFASLFIAMGFTAAVRLRLYLRWKRAKATRLEEELFPERRE